MSTIQRIQAIIFDMDNTLLRSKIDFAAMKREIYEFLADKNLCSADLPLEQHTTSTIVALARLSGFYTLEIDRRVWEIAARHERQGMSGADLEPGAEELLKSLHGQFVLTLLTNNSLTAAEQALEETGIRSYFTGLAGREQMTELKPSPSGLHYLLRAFPHLPVESWISIGDSWIDGIAAKEAGIAFLAYRAKRTDMESRGIGPLGYLSHISEVIPYVF